MQTVTVALGGQEYQIRPLPVRKSREWRQKLDGPFSNLVGVLSNADKIELNDGAQLARLLRTVSGTLINSPDLVWELLFEYSPELAADQERLEEQAYDHEGVEALCEVLKLAYPFGRVAKVIGKQPG